MKLLTYQDTRQRFFNPFHTTTSALDDVAIMNMNNNNNSTANNNLNNPAANCNNNNHNTLNNNNPNVINQNSVLSAGSMSPMGGDDGGSVIVGAALDGRAAAEGDVRGVWPRAPDQRAAGQGVRAEQRVLFCDVLHAKSGPQSPGCAAQHQNARGDAPSDPDETCR
ncbi:hypothetical protein quinque_011813 [Culex quinquefasciatus]